MATKSTRELPGQLSFNLDLGVGFQAEFSTPANTLPPKAAAGQTVCWQMIDGDWGVGILLGPVADMPGYSEIRRTTHGGGIVYVRDENLIG